MSVKIDTDAEINSVRLKESVAPSTPASGYGQLYTKSDGKLYHKNDAGVEFNFADGWILAGETWTYASADDPSFVFDIAGNYTGTYSAGQRIKLTQTTDKYFIITKVDFVSGTTTAVNIYGGTDYNLVDAAITTPQYSRVKAPAGFPLEVTKWQVVVTDSTLREKASPATGTWYYADVGSININVPIGSWELSYQVCSQVNRAAASSCPIFVALSTSSSSATDAELKVYNVNAPVTGASGIAFRVKMITVSAKTPYYLIVLTDTTSIGSLYFRNDNATCVLRAVCAYL